MLIVVSIALGVYPQDPMKPDASELFSSLLLLKAKSMWALERKDILHCMFQPTNTVKECRNTVCYHLLSDCGDKMFLCQNKMEGSNTEAPNEMESMSSSRLRGNSSELVNSDYSCPWITDVHEQCCVLHIHVILYSAQKKKNIWFLKSLDRSTKRSKWYNLYWHALPLV